MTELGADRRYDVDGVTAHVASLDDVIASEQTAHRPRDRATPPILDARRDDVQR